MLEEEIKKDCYYKKDPDNEIFNRNSYGLNIEGKKKYLLSPRNDKYLRTLRLNRDLTELMKKTEELQKERQKKYPIFDRFNEERLIKIYSNKNTIETEGNITRRPNVFKSQQSIYDSNILNKINTEIQPKVNNTIDIGKDNKIKELFKSEKKAQNSVNILTKFRNKEKCFIDSIDQKSRHKHRYNLKSLKIFKPKPSIILPIINPRKIIIDTQLFNDSGIEDKDKSFGSCSQCMGERYNPQNYEIKSKNRTKRNQFGSLYLH